ncbi:hypothetical protein [Streptomyces coelicoflavus]|uniref:Uncharacterized protein n=1 Tax=Streptomyces coelicoflavus TaxID=285562 RepID=A0A6N9UTX9_9ACTN|nr:hypothetical protein [Streptomyces coelicoflavus]
MKNPFDHALRQLALEAAEQVTNDLGRIHTADFQNALIERLRHDQGLSEAVLYKASQALARDFGERRNPRRRRRDNGFYHPHSVMRLGQGIWVWMKDSTPTDMAQWALISSRNSVQVITAEADKQQYTLERTDAYRANPSIKRLSQLEETVFHYRQDPLDDLAFDEP